MAAQYDVNLENVRYWSVVWKRFAAGQAPGRSLALKISVILVIQIKVLIIFESVKTLRLFVCTQNNNETLRF